MNTVINIYAKKAKNYLEVFKEKEYEVDVKFENVHLKKLNTLVKEEMFSKNDLFAGGKTLFDLMQLEKGKDQHNYHGLTPEDILEALKNIKTPYSIFESDDGRISIVSSIMSHFGHPLAVIIELNGSLKGDTEANINKLVTMFPVGDIEEFMSKKTVKEIYYLNKGNETKEKAHR